MVFKCFSLCVFSSPLPFPWAQQPGGAAVQHPSPRTLQQGVEQQQLQWVREQLGVWLREREQLQREWRQQALALLQPRGKGSHSLWFGVAILYYTHSDLFSSPGALGGDAKKKKNGCEKHRDPPPGTLRNASYGGCWGRLKQMKQKWRRKWPCDISHKLEPFTRLTACWRFCASLPP